MIDGADLVPVPPIDTPAAIELLSAYAGPQRAQTEQDQLATLAAHCFGHPLTLTLLGAHLAARPQRSVAALTQFLLARTTASHNHLENAVHLAFNSLSPSAATLACRLTLLPGKDFDAAAAVALLDISVEDVHELLDELLRAGLLRETASDRAELENLVREYAEHLLTAEERADREAARARAIRHYLVKAATIAKTLAPGKYHQAPIYDNVTALNSKALAVAWFEADRHNILGAQLLAEGHDDDSVWMFGDALWTVLRQGAHLQHLAVVQRRAATAAANVRHPYESTAMARYGWALTSMGQHEEAIVACQAATRTAKRHGDSWSIATAHATLARAYRSAGNGDDALVHLEQAIRADQNWGAPDWVAGLRLRQRAEVLSALHRHDEAIVEAEIAANMILSDSGRRTEAGRTFTILGKLLLAAGRPERAITALMQAQLLLSDSGSAIYLAENHLLLGDTHRDRGDIPAAHTRYADASALFRSAGHHQYADLAQSRIQRNPM